MALTETHTPTAAPVYTVTFRAEYEWGMGRLQSERRTTWEEADALAHTLTDNGWSAVEIHQTV